MMICTGRLKIDIIFHCMLSQSRYLLAVPCIVVSDPSPYPPLPQKVQKNNLVFSAVEGKIGPWYPCTSGCVRLLGEQAEDVLDFPSARVGIGSKLVWEYIGMPSRITTRVSYSLFSVVGSKVVS